MYRKNSILGIILSAMIVLSASCGKQQELKAGKWRGVFVFEENNPIMELPFTFTVSGTADEGKIIEIKNGEEIVTVDEIALTDGSIVMKLPVFQSEIAAEIKGDSLRGTYYPRGRGGESQVPFYALYGVEERFPDEDKEPFIDVTGTWKVVINPGTEGENTIFGKFSQDGNYLSGTFLSSTGDYRFLEGEISGQNFMLSCFDGTHSYLARAKISKEGTLENGIFASGPGRKNTWRAVPTENIDLPDAEKMTYLKEGFDTFSFSFPNLHREMVGLDDEKYRNKVVIIQIMGSWCPNCMDATRFLAELYDKYNPQGLEIIALCFERDNFETAKSHIERFKKDLNAHYDFLYAGLSDKQKASETLPMLNRVISYPTFIFIDRKGEIRRIYTGFTGPATGEFYIKIVNDTVQLIEKLLNEK